MFEILIDSYQHCTKEKWWEHCIVIPFDIDRYRDPKCESFDRNVHWLLFQLHRSRLNHDISNQRIEFVHLKTIERESMKNYFKCDHSDIVDWLDPRFWSIDQHYPWRALFPIWIYTCKFDHYDQRRSLSAYDYHYKTKYMLYHWNNQLWDETIVRRTKFFSEKKPIEEELFAHWFVVEIHCNDRTGTALKWSISSWMTRWWYFPEMNHFITTTCCQQGPGCLKLKCIDFQVSAFLEQNQHSIGVKNAIPQRFRVSWKKKRRRYKSEMIFSSPSVIIKYVPNDSIHVLERKNTDKMLTFDWNYHFRD